jgi:hypothetical protein
MTKSAQAALPGETLVLDSAPKPPAPRRNLPPARFQEAVFARGVYHAQVPDGVTTEELLANDFWPASIRNRLRIGDRIEVCDDYMENFWILWCVAANHHVGKATLDVLFHKERVRTEMIGSAAGAFGVKYEGAFEQWVVRRTLDDKVMRNQFRTKEDAERYVRVDLTPNSINAR